MNRGVWQATVLGITWETTAQQAPLSSTISQSLFKFMSIESMMLSNHLILCYPLLLLPSVFSNIKVFSNDLLFTSGGQSIGASVSVLPMNIQGWFHLGLTGLISLQSKELSRVFSSTTIGKHQFFGIAFLWDWNEDWHFPGLWPLLSFPNWLAYWVQHFHSIIFQDLK